MDYKNIIFFLISSLIALSGWGTVIYNHITSTPKIKGRVLNVMRGNMNDPSKPDQKMATFTTYAYLINVRKNTIHMLDYEMEIEIDGKWIRLKRVYGLQNIQHLSFLATDGTNIEINNFSNNLINRKNLPVEYGKPLHGWIVFAGDIELYNKEVSRYKITCIDAYNERHVFESRPEEFVSIPLLQDMADIRNIPITAVNH